MITLKQAKQITRVIFALVFVGAGIGHFVLPDLFVRIVPPALPAPLLLVYISGVAEIVLGIGLLIPGLSRWAAWGLIALLIAVYPANLYVAFNVEQFRDLIPNDAVNVGRLAFQFVMIGIAFWLTREDETPETESEPV
ncbi:MAG: DoxX family membrane protein [Chloroflexi bacterium]|nr:DoxX family membrane protein [Chloroflexota bacterium]